MRLASTLVALAVVGQLLGTTSECAAKPKRASRAKARTAPMASKPPSASAPAPLRDNERDNERGTGRARLRPRASGAARSGARR
ncbi:MAG: hypothetical protein IPG50_34940 [Myxococcales bacterium]|nr:hypothetical protein [Myxococcales bacterium]